MIVDLLNSFQPDPDILLRTLSAHIDDDMLSAIALADYGLRHDEHLAALRQVRDTGTFPDELHWCPMEVLELIRWSEPEDLNWKPGRTGESGHWMRAFSCAAILRAEHEPYDYGYNDGSTDSTIIQLIWSLRSLPTDFTSESIRNLSWLLLQAGPDGQNDQVRIYGAGLFWLALHAAPSLPDQALISLARWITRRADELNWRSAEGQSGLAEMVLGCQKRKAWQLLGYELCNLDLAGHSSDLQVWAQMIGEQLMT